MSANFLLNVNGKPYKPARFVNGKKPYIEYWMYHVQKGKAVRRRFYKIEGSSHRQKREHAKRLVKQINKLLVEGYVFGREVPEVERTGVAVPNLLDAMQQIVEIKEAETGDRSRHAYRSFVNVFTEWYNEQKINRLATCLKREHVLRFLDWLVTDREYRGNKGVSNVTRNNYLNKLVTLLEEMKQRNMIQENPAKGIKRLRETVNNNIAFTDAQMEKLTVYLKRLDPNLYVFTQFIYYCFIRPVELTRIRVRDIDLKNRVIIIRAEDSKNRKQDNVVIPKPLIEVIKGMRLHTFPSSYYVFSKNDLGPGDTKIIRNRISERHAKAIKACGMQDSGVYLYSWKHTGNKNAYLAGVDIKTIQMQNRHSSLQMTDKYLRSLGVRLNKDLLDKEW